MNSSDTAAGSWAIMPRHIARSAERASLSQLAERPRPARGALAQPMSLAQARRADSTPLAKKEWRNVDDIVGLMDAEKSEFSSLQQLV